MPRQKRLDVPGQIYHIISRGLERRKIFRDRDDRKEFLIRLSEGLRETEVHCYAWVLMGNHFHLLLRPMLMPISKLMRKVLTGYALYFNARHKRVGHLFQNRYKSILCQEDAYFKQLVGYIHLNPVRANIVKTSSELANYPWCGHGYILGKRKNNWQKVDEVLSWFGKGRKTAIKRYQGYIDQCWGLGTMKQFSGGGLYRSGGTYTNNMADRERYDSRILGDGDFVSEVLKESTDLSDQKNKLKLSGWDLERLIKYVAKKFNFKPDELIAGRRYRHLSEAKGVVSFYATEILDFSLEEVAKRLRMSKQGVYYLKPRGEYFSKENKNFIT